MCDLRGRKNLRVSLHTHDLERCVVLCALFSLSCRAKSERERGEMGSLIGIRGAVEPVAVTGATGANLFRAPEDWKNGHTRTQFTLTAHLVITPIMVTSLILGPVFSFTLRLSIDTGVLVLNLCLFRFWVDNLTQNFTRTHWRVASEAAVIVFVVFKLLIACILYLLIVSSG